MTEGHFYAGRRALVTGGLGFLGSNLAVRLAQAGALVTVVDACVPGCGASDSHLAEVERQVRVIRANIADTAEFEREIAQADVIFNLAGEISHSRSMEDPLRDLAAIRFRPFPPDHLAFDIGSYSSDTSRIRRDLGWRPQTGFRAGVRETVRWFAGEPTLR